MFSHRQTQSLFISSSASLASLLLLALVGLLIFILVRGGNYFWPATLYQVEFTPFGEQQPKKAFGRIEAEIVTPEAQQWRLVYSTAVQTEQQVLLDRDQLEQILEIEDLAAVTLDDGRTLYALPVSLTRADNRNIPLSRFAELQRDVSALEREIDRIRDRYLSPVHEQIGELDRRDVDNDAPARLRLVAEFSRWQQRIEDISEDLEAFKLNVAFADGALMSVSFAQIDHMVQPNQMHSWQKFLHALYGAGRFISDVPKQANTAGGVFPALFGTILMVLLMTLIVAPFGVLAAIYLSEYAPHNTFTMVLRVCVNNLAGVPSIVYGVFGLGFFVYTVGGSIDSVFYSEQLPSPTFGTPGLFWAALTMALLTLPVVIVATEEGLKRVPDSLRKGSFALGATKSETIFRTVLPMASPAVMTGLILAIARAAGEVAPLMLVGAVKFAPVLPVDGSFPFLHLERQFMHLGVLIYDGAFHSQHYGKGSSMMFASCLLLLLLVFLLNLLAIVLRNKLRRRYSQHAVY